MADCRRVKRCAGEATPSLYSLAFRTKRIKTQRARACGVMVAWLRKERFIMLYSGRVMIRTPMRSCTARKRVHILQSAGQIEYDAACGERAMQIMR